MTHRVKPARSAGAEILLSRCLGLCPEDRFLLIYDETTLRFPNLFRSVASSLQIDYRKRFVSKVRQANGSAFDAGLEAEIEQVEGILLAVSADPSVDRFRVEMADRRRGRATVATMPGASIEIIDTALDVDYQEITRMARQLAVPLAKGRECTITTFDAQDHPYHLHLDLGGSERMPVQSLALLPRGAWGNVPAGETFIAPVEHVASGEYLVNGAVGRERTLGKDEALLTFEAGRLIEHRYLATGLPVQHLLHLMPIASANNDLASWNVLAEFGIGVNRAIRRIVGVELMDEKKYGTVHIAIGHNEGFGGANVCLSVHCDMTTQRPTVRVDGQLMIERGEHVDDMSAFLDDHRWPPSASGQHRPIATSSWRAQEDHFLLDNLGRLCVIWRTTSGRQTVFCPFTDHTAKSAAALLAGRDILYPRDLAAYASATKMTSQHLEGLVQLLQNYRVLRAES